MAKKRTRVISKGKTTQEATTKQWPADKVERRPVASLVPYARNSRLHSEEQVEQIARSIQTFGWTIPVLIAEDDTIIAGHARVMAANKLGIVDIPVMVARGWSEAQKRAYVIADNQLPQNATWDESLLRVELQELRAENFDLGLVGFNDLQLVEFVTGFGGGNGAQTPEASETEGADRKLTTAEQVLMNRAWVKAISDWRDIMLGKMPGLISTAYTKGTMAVYFLRARFFGSDIPRGATLAYTPHRIHVAAGSIGSIVDLMKRDFDPKVTTGGELMSIQWVCQGRPTIDKMLTSTYPIHSCRLPGDFPVALARGLINEFCKRPGAAVLDPCHGWGGRALGFLLSENAASYVGFDVDPATSRGVRTMVDDLREFSPKKKAVRLELMPFEDGKLAPGSFDFAFTSPPYFDVEKYGGEKSSWRRYPTYEKWLEGFYLPLLRRTHDALKPGAVFALQIGNQSFPLEKAAIELGATLGLAHVETRSTSMVNQLRQTPEGEGEVIVILRRDDNARTSRRKPAAPAAKAKAKAKAKAAIQDPAAAFGEVL